MVSAFMKTDSSLSCETNFNEWIRLKYFGYHNIVRYHHWKILLVGVGLLGLCWLGYKSMEFDKDLMHLWIYNSSRLYNESSYLSRTAGNQLDSGSVETILQVSSDHNLLSTEYLLEHLQLLQLIINLTMRYDGRTFTLAQFCQKIHLPKMHYIDPDTRAYIESFMPCKIITPLNCFWEGSKISVSKEEVVKIDWKSFNVQRDVLNSFKESWPYEFFQGLFTEAGIEGGFVNKPCIDIMDPFCPNKKQKPVSYQSIINVGCYQIARNLYNYSSSIFLGRENKGLQTLLLFRSPADILQTLKINELDWTESKVQSVINLWLKELRKLIIKYNHHRPYLQSLQYKNNKFQSQRTRKSSFYVFTNNSLNNAFNEVGADDTLLARYCVCTSVVMLFAILVFVSSDNLVRSHCWLAITSTFLIVAASISGLGLTAASGFTFSALTTQVVPFLMIGLGLDEVFILTSRYKRTIDNTKNKKNSCHPVAQTLYDCATKLLCSILVKVLVLTVTAFIPVPLMRSFCIQILFITFIQTSINMFLYPCLLHIDYLRRQSNRIDLLCCLLKRQSPMEDVESQSQTPKPPLQYDRVSKRNDIMNSRVIFSTEFTTSPGTLIPNNVYQYCEINPVETISSSESPLPRQTYRPSSKTNLSDIKTVKSRKHRCCWKLRYRISRTFLHIIVLVPVQITVILITIMIIVMGVYSAINIDCGIVLNSIFSRHSNEYNYIEHESKMFGMQTFDIVTKELDYIYQQDSVLQLHGEIQDLPNVGMLENGKFWLSSLILWLQKIQNDFDRDVKDRLILMNGTWMKNASRNGLLAMTLMVQDGQRINYNQLRTSRLVTAQRVDENKFYLFLNVWRSVSVEFDSLPCLLFPKLVPFNMDKFMPNVERSEPLLIRMTSLNLYSDNPLQFVSCKYFYKGRSQRDELAFVKTIRTITGRYSDRGVPTIAIGNIFSLSEQYLYLRSQLLILTVVLAMGVFIICLLTINQLLASVLATLILSSSLLSPMLFMNYYEIPLNATSGVMALWSGGLGFRFSLLLIVSFVEQSSDMEPSMKNSSPMSSDEQVRNGCSGIRLVFADKAKQIRLRRAFDDVQSIKAALSSLFGMAFISMTDIGFLWQHFLLLPCIGLAHSIINYYCLASTFCLYLIRDSKFTTAPTLPIAQKTESYRSKSKNHHRSPSGSSRSHRSHNIHPNLPRFDSDDQVPPHGKLSIIPEESSSVFSSIKSTGSRDKDHIGVDSSSNSSTQSQGNKIRFMKQNIESSLIINYPSSPQRYGKDSSKSVNIPSELAVKTSFKYCQPLAQDQ